MNANTTRWSTGSGLAIGAIDSKKSPVGTINTDISTAPATRSRIADKTEERRATSAMHVASSSKREPKRAGSGVRPVASAASTTSLCSSACLASASPLTRRAASSIVATQTSMCVVAAGTSTRTGDPDIPVSPLGMASGFGGARTQ